MMNERIEKLISEAIEAIPNHVEFNLPKEFTEKFAELIVRECADVGALGMSCTDKGYIKRGVLAHFGVEE